MVNTRAKIKKTQDSTLKTSCFSQGTMLESDNDESTKSGALIGSNDDLLNEILGRLPAKSILRFKSVSKHWLSLLTHPRFTLLFDKLLNSPGLFVRKLYVPFDVENPSPPPLRNLDFFPDPYGIKIVQSCNGLLLCCSKKGPAHLRKYYVFNPTTKQFAVIPSVGKAVTFMGLAYHPTECVHFKLLCIHHPDHADPGDFLFELLIYSSHTKEWKFILSQSLFTSWDTPFFTSVYGVYWNQAFYWVPCTLDTLYFKLDEERLLPMSTNLMDGTQIGDYQDGSIPMYFGESRGHLHLVDQRLYDMNPLHLDVYEMLSDHSGWFVKYQVDLDELPAAYPEMITQLPSIPIYYDFRIQDFVRGEKEEDTFMVVSFPAGKIIRYNILDKSFNQIFIINKIYRADQSWNVHRYTETLTSF